MTIADLTALWRIRLFEERVLLLRKRDEIVGSVHLCIGQESVAVGTCSVLQPQDTLFATYRGHGWAIARGVPLEPLFAELLGRRTGVNGGRGGSAYFSAPEWGFFGENSIVGAGAPIAAGAALAATFDDSRRVAVTVFGDGAMNQGAVHEALNMASAFDLPLVFVCENNTWSELTPIDAMVKNPNLHERASGYGIPGIRIDGNDLALVRATVDEAVARARSGRGPTLVEAMTQRITGHYIGDAELYRRPGEIEHNAEVEPIARLSRELAAAGVNADALDDARTAALHEVDTACAAALAAPPADTTTVLEHVHG